MWNSIYLQFHLQASDKSALQGQTLVDSKPIHPLISHSHASHVKNLGQKAISYYRKAPAERIESVTVYYSQQLREAGSIRTIRGLSRKWSFTATVAELISAFHLLWTSNHEVKSWNLFFALGGLWEGKSKVSLIKNGTKDTCLSLFSALSVPCAFPAMQKLPKEICCDHKNCRVQQQQQQQCGTCEGPASYSISWLIRPNIALIEDTIQARHIGLTQAYAHTQIHICAWIKINKIRTRS